MSEKRFYLCKHCGNLISKIQDSGVPVICCGEPMTELVPGSVDASLEKHVPVVSVNGDRVTVSVGSVAHPMTPEHYIQWIYLQTEHGGQRKSLNPGEAPEVTFVLDHDQPLAAFAYCNLHGLWKKDI